jgi:hypothetical protein
MGYNSYLKDIFAVWEKLRRMAPVETAFFFGSLHPLIQESADGGFHARSALPMPSRNCRPQL